MSSTSPPVTIDTLFGIELLVGIGFLSPKASLRTPTRGHFNALSDWFLFTVYTFYSVSTNFVRIFYNWK
jgi:hypothetical protein